MDMVEVHMFFFIIVFFSSLRHRQGRDCYDADGSVLVGDRAFYPEREQYFCCGALWACISSGICSRANNKEIAPSGGSPLRRGTCTDRTWSSAECPQFCKTVRGRQLDQ